MESSSSSLRSNSSSLSLLELPVICLETANFDGTLGDVIATHPTTVLDFWTTKCTRCPEALDALNEIAAAASSSSSQPDHCRFVSICCDSLDGAREILQRPKGHPRWNAMHHYSMPVVEHKERAKQILKFAQVPFYAIFNPTGTLLYSGRKLDRTILAAAMAAQHQQIAPPSILNAISTTGLPPELSTLLETVQTDRMTEERMFSPSVKSAPMTGSNEKEAPYYLANSLDSPSNVFAIDDLDF